MKITHILAATGLTVTALTAAVPVNAQNTGDHHYSGMHRDNAGQRGYSAPVVVPVRPVDNDHRDYNNRGDRDGRGYQGMRNGQDGWDSNHRPFEWRNGRRCYGPRHHGHRIDCRQMQ